MICTRCLQELPAEAFYKSPAKVCKECHKAQMKEHYQTPGYRAKNAGYQRARLDVPENLVKHKARQAVRGAVKRGEIIKERHCALCNSGQDIESHHRDYSKKLEVIWLCRNCHAIHHAAEAVKQANLKDKPMSKSSNDEDINHIIQYAILTK